MRERVISMDITNFMTWFIEQVVDMFTSIFTILDSIEFLGTSLLKVILTILILTSLLSVVLTIGKSSSVVASRADKVKTKRERNRSNEEN